MGYEYAFEYEGGKQDWVEAGYQLRAAWVGVGKVLSPKDFGW